jgi:hypothetical protein
MPCVGGDGAIERLAYAATCGHGRSLGELKNLTAKLLRDPDFYAATVIESQRQAREKLGYEAVASQLQQFFKSLARSA